MKRAYFTIADKNNLKYYEMLKESLSKFSDDKLILIDEDKVNQLGDPYFYYRATPIVAKGLLKKYDAVCKLDADTIITGNIDHIWEGDYDVAVVKNSNPKEDARYPVRLMDIHPLSYVNCGFVVMKSKGFVENWLKLCMSDHFLNFQYREQDLLNIMVFYMSEPFGGQWKVRHLDDGNRWHGLISKGYWPNIGIANNPETGEKHLFLDKNDEWPKDDVKIISAIHWAGGNVGKMNYRLHFKPKVVKYLDKLIKP